MENSRRHTSEISRPGIKTDLSNQLEIEENHQYENIYNITNDSFLKNNKRKYNEQTIINQEVYVDTTEQKNIFYTKNDEPEDILLIKKPKLSAHQNIGFTDQAMVRKKFDHIVTEYKGSKGRFSVESFDSKVNDLFVDLIKICYNDHLLDKIPNLVYEHISLYNKALRMKKNKDTDKLQLVESWIVDLFNQLTTPFDEIKDVNEILLTDFFLYNKKYIHHLKLVVIQLMMLKNEQKNECIES